MEGAKAIAAVLKDAQLSTLRSTPARCLHAMSLPCRPQKCTAPAEHFSSARSLVNNRLCGVRTDEYGDRYGTYTAEGITALCEGLKGSAVTSLG